MRRWTCLAWSLSFGMTVGVAAADSVPPAPQRTSATEDSQPGDVELPPTPVDAASNADATSNADAGLPATVISQSTLYPAPAPATAPKPAAPKPPPQPWKGVFFDNDFSYKKDPNHTPLFGENFKDIQLGCDDCCDTRISFGGEIRYRYMDELNRLRPGGPGRSTYDLVRWRNYLDLKHSDWVRAYVEMINADIYNNDLPVTGIDRNRWDLQNYFVDLKILERDDKPVWLRVGRQELLFGSQRLVSPLDWGNTRRNFEGIRIKSPGTDWDLDAWLTNPVNTATPGTGGGIGPNLGVNYLGNRFDSADHDIIFGGGWATYKGIKDHTFDTFLLWSQYNSVFPGGTGYPLGNRFTYGHRWLGTFNVDGGDRAYLTDIEGGYQFGNDHGQSVQAGYVTTGFGHQWKAVPWKPTLWGFYDYASGDGNSKDGVNNTFFQYYGLVHAYLGLIDNIARQNISDINWRLQLQPTPKLNLQVAQHFFQLANSNDTLYSVTGSPVGSTGFGSNVGNELDLLASYTVNQNLSIEAGYFEFWYGNYINSNPATARGNAQQFYVQTTLRY